MGINPQDFTPNHQLDDEQRSTLLKINIEFPEFAKMLEELLPASQQKDRCMADLLSAKFFATQSVTHGKDSGGSIPSPRPVPPKADPMKADAIVVREVVMISSEPEATEATKTDAEMRYAAELAKAENALALEPDPVIETKEEAPLTQTTAVEEDAEKAAF